MLYSITPAVLFFLLLLSLLEFIRNLALLTMLAPPTEVQARQSTPQKKQSKNEAKARTNKTPHCMPLCVYCLRVREFTSYVFM